MVGFKSGGLIGCLLLSALAQDISLLDGSTTCDANCKKIALGAAQWERSQHAYEPLDLFYETPKEFGPNTPPGTVLRVEKHTNLTNYTIPSGLTMSRLLYTSQDLNGTTVLASAFALWPYEIFDYTKGVGHLADANAKYPLVAWAHGTSGPYQRCAPSIYKALQYHFITTFPIAFEGFAIIAPDYAGLGASARPDGSKHPHQYIAGPSQANDLAFAIEAVRKAFPDRLDSDGPFTAMGHSQGGFTSWAFAERQVKTPVPGYKGTIIISPPIGAVAGLKQALQAAVNGAQSSAQIFNLLPLINNGITAVYPSFNFAGLNKHAYDIVNKVLAPLEGCLPSFTLMNNFITLDDYIEGAAWINRTETLEWEKRVAVSNHSFASPVFAIIGGKDIVPVANVAQAVKDTCALKENNGKHLEYLEMENMGHFPVISTSRSRWMQWIKDRISDKPLKTQCGVKTTVPGIDTNFTTGPGDFPPNWLVEGVASKQEQWKLVL